MCLFLCIGPPKRSQESPGVWILHLSVCVVVGVTTLAARGVASTRSAPLPLLMILDLLVLVIACYFEMGSAGTGLRTSIGSLR